MLKAVVPPLCFYIISRKMVLARTVKFLYGTSASILSAPYSLATIAKRRPKWEASSSLPVAGIDALCAQSILFCLQRSVADAKVSYP